LRDLLASKHYATKFQGSKYMKKSLSRENYIKMKKKRKKRKGITTDWTITAISTILKDRKTLINQVIEMARST